MDSEKMIELTQAEPNPKEDDLGGLVLVRADQVTIVQRRKDSKWTRAHTHISCGEESGCLVQETPEEVWRLIKS